MADFLRNKIAGALLCHWLLIIQVTYISYNFFIAIFLAELIQVKLPGDKMDNLKSAVNSFYRYVQEREDQKLGENLKAIPIRFSPDKCIYKKLTAFQRDNTLVFYDRRQPKKVLGYMLVMPAMKGVITKPKIWSWTLVFQFGKYVFQSVTGQLGYEYMFSPKGLQQNQKAPNQ